MRCWAVPPLAAAAAVLPLPPLAAEVQPVPQRSTPPPSVVPDACK